MIKWYLFFDTTMSTPHKKGKPLFSEEDFKTPGGKKKSKKSKKSKKVKKQTRKKKGKKN